MCFREHRGNRGQASTNRFQIYFLPLISSEQHLLPLPTPRIHREVIPGIVTVVTGRCSSDRIPVDRERRGICVTHHRYLIISAGLDRRGLRVHSTGVTFIRRIQRGPLILTTHGIAVCPLMTVIGSEIETSSPSPMAGASACYARGVRGGGRGGCTDVCSNTYSIAIPMGTHQSGLSALPRPLQ